LAEVCLVRTNDLPTKGELTNVLTYCVAVMMQILGILYMGTLLIFPALYIYEQLVEIITPCNLLAAVILSTFLVPLAWILYIAIEAVVLCSFGAKVLLPLNRKSQPSALPLWSVSYVRWWTNYRLQDFASSTLACYLRGTVFLSYWYRLMGAEIDDGVLLETNDITDPALVSIGSGTVIGEGATLQSHEVNSGSIRIGRECVVGPHAVVQSGSTLHSGSKVGALGKTEVGEHVLGTGLQKNRSQVLELSPTQSHFRSLQVKNS
jgi:carbonic anhydrase/acetyltransferase-like protein (isoleucine patch superfamily)